MIRLTNPNEHEVHIPDPRTKTTTCLSPAKAVRVKSKVYEILIEEQDLKFYDTFIRMKMIKGERVLPVKSNADQNQEVDTPQADGSVLVLGSAPGKSAVAAAVAASHPAPASAPVAPAAVPARKFNCPPPVEADVKASTKPPLIPRRKA